MEVFIERTGAIVAEGPKQRTVHIHFMARGLKLVHDQTEGLGQLRRVLRKRGLN